MRIQKRYWFSLAALAVIGFVVFQTLPPVEPVVNGQPLKYWLDQYWQNNFQDGNPEDSKKIEAALSAMDDRCIRALTEDLKRKPSPLVKKLNDWAERWMHLHHPFGGATDRRAMAALVLGRFGTRATNAIPVLDGLRHAESSGESESWISPGGAAIAALVLIRHDSVETCAKKALDLADPDCPFCQDAIVCLETNAASAIPIFAKAIEVPVNNEQKQYAARALGTIHSRPELSLPPLISLLKDTNSQSRHISAFELRRFESLGKAAWNDLVICLNDPDELVRVSATNALLSIDSGAAQRLGISSPP